MKLKTGIDIVQGKPGSGKTTYLAIQAQKYLKKGYKVWSNTPIVGCNELNIREHLMKFDISDGLVIIDEAGLEMNSREFKTFSKNMYEFFTTHRHYRVRVIIAVQYWDRVDIVCRELVNRIFVVKKSILPFFIVLRKISVNITVNEDKKIDEEFAWIPLFLGGRSYHFVYYARRLFDTHIRKNLPSYNFNKYQKAPKILTNL